MSGEETGELQRLRENGRNVYQTGRKSSRQVLQESEMGRQKGMFNQPKGKNHRL